MYLLIVKCEQIDESVGSFFVTQFVYNKLLTFLKNYKTDKHQLEIAVISL